MFKRARNRTKGILVYQRTWSSQLIWTETVLVEVCGRWVTWSRLLQGFPYFWQVRERGAHSVLTADFLSPRQWTPTATKSFPPLIRTNGENQSLVKRIDFPLSGWYVFFQTKNQSPGFLIHLFILCVFFFLSGWGRNFWCVCASSSFPLRKGEAFSPPLMRINQHKHTYTPCK